VRKTILALLALLPLTVPAPLRADPLTLGPSSFLVLDIDAHFYRFLGSSFDIRETELMFILGQLGPTCFNCRTGDIVDLSFRTGADVSLGAGEGVINGVAFPELTFRGSLDFQAPAVSFPNVDVTEDFIRITPPFVFGGFFRALAGGTEVFANELRGVGTASVLYERLDAETFIPDEGAIVYSFRQATEPAPVPEPSTMLLVGLGAVGIRRFIRREPS
jgi:PEP-CTERM motif